MKQFIAILESTTSHLRGQAVRHLVVDLLIVGWYGESWIGLDESGLPVATSVNVARLNSDGGSSSFKMLYLKWV